MKQSAVKTKGGRSNITIANNMRQCEVNSKAMSRSYCFDSALR